MKVIVLYQHTNKNGDTMFLPHRPCVKWRMVLRLIADEDKLLTQDGKTFYVTADADTSYHWYGVDAKIIKSVDELHKT